MGRRGRVYIKGEWEGESYITSQVLGLAFLRGNNG